MGRVLMTARLLETSAPPVEAPPVGRCGVMRKRPTARAASVSKPVAGGMPSGSASYRGAHLARRRFRSPRRRRAMSAIRVTADKRRFLASYGLSAYDLERTLQNDFAALPVGPLQRR